MDVDKLLKVVVDMGASDLHLRVATPPVLRVDGALISQPDSTPLTAEDLKEVFEAITTSQQREAFYSDLELDFAYAVPGLARFRVNVLKQRGTLGLALRLVPSQVPSIDELDLPRICKDLILRPRGLILVTGPAGSGKSTTMAAMIHHLNENNRRNIITIEDPIEYLHRDIKSIIAQRDLGDDTKSFDIALRHSLRQDPDVIVVGELRDLETITIAVRAAETGHLVLGTLHTTDAAQTVDRIIDVYPPHQQSQIRIQVSQVMEAILSQFLVPRLTGKGRVGVFEIMIATPAVRNLIREGRTHELVNIMQLSGKDGMQTLDQALANLVTRRMINRDEAMKASSYPERLGKLLSSGYRKRLSTI